jgi:hypothetical protein
MRLVVALWLAILHALAAAPAVRGPATLGARRICAEAPAPGRADPQAACGNATTVRAGDQRLLHEGLRIARPVVGQWATGGQPRTVPVVPLGALVAATRIAGEAMEAVDVRARALDASHATASRGAVLPFFGTAPPLQS